MGIQVVMGGMAMCTFGAGPGSYIVLPTNKVMAGNVPAGNIMDYVPFLNIVGFNMCTSMSNPAVASATSAASGVLTPMPCTPAVAAPWTPGCTKTMIANMPALNNSCTATCSFGGTITISVPGQFKVMCS